MSTDANGHAPVDLAHVDTHAARAAERLAAQTTALRELLADEDAVQERLRTALDESKQRQHGLRRAIDALDPPVKEPKAEAKRGPGRPAATDGRSAKYVRPSDETIERVMELLRAEPEPIAISKLADHGGGTIGRDTVRRAIYALRDDGRVRIAGRAGMGGGNVYAAMPEELSDDDDGDNVLWNAGAKATS